MEMGYEFVKEAMEKIVGQEVECGCLIVLHTVGRKCDYKPHLHVMLMSGGIMKQGEWVSIDKFGFSILNQLWKTTLLSGMREWDTLNEFEKIFDTVEKRYKGFYTNIDLNSAPKKR